MRWWRLPCGYAVRPLGVQRASYMRVAEMKRKRALELQQAWGDQPCPHPAFAKEYDLGARTGNFVCTQCGAILSFREKAEIAASRRLLDSSTDESSHPEAAE